MAAQYTIRSRVVDIRGQLPAQNDQVFVDTNVWFWSTYSKASHPAVGTRHHQIRHYPTFLKNARTIGAGLHVCDLVLPELMHQIEESERLIYLASSGLTDITRKEFRHNHPHARHGVVQEVAAAWGTVEQICGGSSHSVGAVDSTQALADFASMPLDGYDMYFHQVMEHLGLDRILTDDGDFCMLDGITVLTANLRVIDLARQQNRLRSM